MSTYEIFIIFYTKKGFIHNEITKTLAKNTLHIQIIVVLVLIVSELIN
jgi:hypothetical protein